MVVGKSVKRVDAYDKVTGRAKYTDDLADRSAYIIKLVHSTIAHGHVKGIDASEALKIPGVVKVVTCFDVPDFYFPTAGHPWSTDPKHQDVSDRLLLVSHVRYYGDEIAAVIAEDEIAANRAVKAIRVEYEELPFVLDAEEAMRDGAPQLHENYPGNILNKTEFHKGDFSAAISEPGLIKVEGVYETPQVQHCHIENHLCFAEVINNKVTVTSSTQIPHIVRRIVGQALGIPWGSVRIIKPYIGGGFGNKQDSLYEPLCAYLSTAVGGRLVKLDTTREETFTSSRTRHAIRYHLTSYVRKDGSIAALNYECYSNQGAYTSHGHGIAAKGMGGAAQLYKYNAFKGMCCTVFTNRPVAGAMRGYGIPQAMFALESHMDDIARTLGEDPVLFRKKNVMPVGYKDNFSKNVNYFDSFNQCMDRGRELLDYDKKFIEYKNQTGPVRRGVGMAIFWYNTAVWPISLESSSCRMVVNQDGSLQVQLAETEIGQGADTAFAQMTADTVGVPFESVHVISAQDTDVTPFGTGAYASRQTYVGGFAIQKTGALLKDKMLEYAHYFTRMAKCDLDISDGNVVWKPTGETLLTVGELATEALYSLERSEHFSAETTAQIKTNAYSFGCSFAEVEVDIPLGKAKLISLVNVHDCGRLINPQLAEAQVHGGMSMAIGLGMYEQMIFDPKTGRLLNGNLLDYKLCTTMDHPDLTAGFIENYEPTSPFGTKALGEPPTVSGAPAIRNAILQATGVAVDTAPINPHTLFARFTEEGLIKEV